MSNVSGNITFKQIFDIKVEVGEDDVTVNKIVIPQIQRDYAQGRQDVRVDRVRERFLNSLHDAILGDPIKLDFIYGDVDRDGTLIPLDGQQRLTTLFLLHWYAAKKESIPESEYAFLKNFSYATRPSARDFCSELVNFNPSFEVRISEEINDAAWFPLGWKKDPTVASMLVMLDSIAEKFKDTAQVWQGLTGGKITFYFRSINEMGLTDELYIKMNSRGKPLTTFEYFKAELEHYLKAIDEKMTERIMGKIDREWTDLLWTYRDKDNGIDDAFLRYFRFICDVLCFEDGRSTLKDPKDEFKLLEKYFSGEKAKSNAEVFEKYFDIWCKNDAQALFEKYISSAHATGKIIYRGEINLFKDCLFRYANVGDDVVSKDRNFTLAEFIRLYAVTVYLLNYGTVNDKEFSRRLRTVNNLVLNSREELNESDDRRGGNRIPGCLEVVKKIMIEGIVEEKFNTFNVHQLKEEAEKLIWTEANPTLAESLFELEDNDYLYGQIGIVGLDKPDNFKKFNELFTCNLNEINRALLATGNYMQWDRNWYRLGANRKSVWEDIFHRSIVVWNFEETKRVLCDLLSANDKFTDGILRGISDNYLKTCENKKEYDWRYYFIKYPEFLPARYGKYEWKDFDKKPYEVLALWAPKRRSSAAYQPFLKQAMAETGKGRLSEDPDKPALSVGGVKIICKNDAYVFYDSDDKEVNRIDLILNAEGIDTEDRIEILKNTLKNY